MKKLSNGWEFTPMWTNGFRLGEGEGEPVRLPHNPRPIPQHYAGPEDYEGVYGYRKILPLDETMRSKRLFLQFDGAAHIATVFMNGRELLTHRTGYTAFRVEITDAVRLDGTDLLAVRLDSTENPEIPPFGYVIDYLTYGGLYRDVWLDVRNPVCIANVFAQTPNLHTLKVQTTVSGTATMLRHRVLNAAGACVAQNADANSDSVVLNHWSTRKISPCVCSYIERLQLIQNHKIVPCRRARIDCLLGPFHYTDKGIEQKRRERKSFI